MPEYFTRRKRTLRGNWPTSALLEYDYSSIFWRCCFTGKRSRNQLYLLLGFIRRIWIVKSLLHYISGGMVPKSILQKLHLDWTQQIGIYLDQNGISAHKLFQNAHHDFLFQRKFHSIESFEEYFNYYWSHARNFVTDAENQKNSIQRIMNISTITTKKTWAGRL